VGYLLGRKLKERRERRLLTQSSHSALPRGIRDASIAHRSLASGTSSMNRFDRYEPGQFVRFLWFIAIMFVPPGAVAYVWLYNLPVGNEDALRHVLLILAVSLTTTVICAIAQPIKYVDEAQLIKLGRGSACLALFFALMGAEMLRCQSGAGCHSYPLGLWAMAGAFFCWSVWCYLTRYVNCR